MRRQTRGVLDGYEQLVSRAGDLVAFCLCFGSYHAARDLAWAGRRNPSKGVGDSTPLVARQCAATVQILIRRAQGVEDVAGLRSAFLTLESSSFRRRSLARRADYAYRSNTATLIPPRVDGDHALGIGGVLNLRNGRRRPFARSPRLSRGEHVNAALQNPRLGGAWRGFFQIGQQRRQFRAGLLHLRRPEIRVALRRHWEPERPHGRNFGGLWWLRRRGRYGSD